MRRRHLESHGEAVILIAIGGILGANLRYATGAVAGEALWMTVAVNAIGSFGLGLLLFDARADVFLSRRFRYIFATGFFASFTTYSTFIADIALSTPMVAIWYLTASYAAGFSGIVAARLLVSRVSDGPLRTDGGGGGA